MFKSPAFRFICILTALECYHCNQALVNYTDCNTTKACNAGEVGILYKSKLIDAPKEFSFMDKLANFGSSKSYTLTRPASEV